MLIKNATYISGVPRFQTTRRFPTSNNIATSIYLQSLRKSKSELSAFLFKRGLWLILVEVILITFAWTFDFSYSIFILQVIWAIGICMVLMGIIIRLPYTLILIAGLAIVFGHNILDVIPSTHQGFWWDLLHNGNFAFHRQDHCIYPSKLSL